LKSIK